MYSEENLVRIARRENNSKRGYLVLNTLQGKHMPAPPTAALGQFAALAERVRARFVGERMLIVGFAETATAIGAALAASLGCAFLQTTRERVPDRSYLHFTEAHSHATEQKLDKADMARCIPDIDRVVFAEDELTTGNTILNLVDALEQTFGRRLRFAAACLLSGMPPAAQDQFAARGIALDALLCIDYSGYDARVLAYPSDGAYHCLAPLPAGQEAPCSSYPGRLDARRLVDGSAYHAACQVLARRVLTDFPVQPGARILVLGTEEFMYPGLCLAAQMEEAGAQVRFHATTRSPMVVCAQAAYPLHCRHELVSLYDDERRTFLYALDAYDRVFVVTDAPAQQTKGLRTLLAALHQAGNETIQVIRWCDS